MQPIDVVIDNLMLYGRLLTSLCSHRQQLDYLRPRRKEVAVFSGDTGYLLQDKQLTPFEELIFNRSA